ncbi:alpha-amylase-like [Macrosteles quadrilineatus]|uniref:alpha-amylase-like n=1 Tax=Macrosteles quadrilineatus TaxID=74068 RepID=UPI0023E2D69B|nr:alpha-amylase-like [Macrosteles quadrilineatus]
MRLNEAEKIKCDPVDFEEPASPHHQKTFELKSGVIAHMFMWRYSDIANECEQFLSKKGFDAVQFLRHCYRSPPPTDHVEAAGLMNRYQVVSYQLINRLGSEHQLRDMVNRCNSVGVRVFANVVFNHMTIMKENLVGTGGSSVYPKEMYYPGVPYTKEDFHPPCDIPEDKPVNAKQMRECQKFGMNDLDQSRESVREKIVHHLNHLIEIGVAGFSIDSAINMHPDDLSVIYQRVNHLNTEHGFPAETRPMIYQDVLILDGTEPVKYEEYTPLGLVMDYKFGRQLGKFFLSEKNLNYLENFGSEASNLSKKQRVVFVEDYITERIGDVAYLNYQNPKRYKMAVMFMLAHGDYTSKIFSSFQFSKYRQEPSDLPPRPIKKNICSNGWECQHRWHQIYSAVEFHNVVQGTPVTDWWSNGVNQIAFCRGNKGFVAFNLDSVELNKNLQTRLPEGEYCDIISGEVTTTGCSGKTIKVGKDGKARILIPKFDPASVDDGFVAIHIQSGIVYE